jgi:Fic family protein
MDDMSDQLLGESPLSARAGRYVPQPGGYAAFVPRLLPPDPPIAFDGELQACLSKADRALGRLDGSIQTLPDPGLFVFMYIRKEAVLSSQIEGTESSINDVLEVEAEVFDPERPKDVGEVLNYISAMNLGLERLRTLPLSVELVREIHRKLLHGVRGEDKQPGELRETQNWIGPPGCAIENATFVPPPPSELVPALAALDGFLNDETTDMPALIRIGLAHAQFETIHPFRDGNGRVGRLMITFFLCQQKILLRPVLYLSHYFRAHQRTYYERLQATRDRGDWEGWLKFFLTGVATVSNQASETARGIVGLRERHRTLITAEFGRAVGHGLQVLEYLLRRPIIQIKEVQQLLEITYPGANNLVRRLVEAGILEEITGYARNRRFRYRSYIDLFSDP